MRRLAAVLAAAMLTTGVSAGATLGAPGEPPGPGTAQPQAGVALICDVKMSVNGGPFTDGPTIVRIGVSVTFRGTGFPASAAIAYTPGEPPTSHAYLTTAPDGTFDWTSEASYYPHNSDSLPDDVRMTFYDPADPAGCSDVISYRVDLPTPFLDISRSTTAFSWEIAWIYRHGITAGCAPTMFCLKEPVTREQMASFLARALSLPPTDVDFFSDDEASIHEDSINRLAAAGITGGCTETEYCPKDTVTRAQMASFLVRAFELAATDTDYFVDDEASMHEAAINALAESRITGGCARDPARFCPASAVTREQMAAFLTRGFISWH